MQPTRCSVRLLVLAFALLTGCTPEPEPILVFSAAPDNDLYTVLDSGPRSFPRYDTAVEAITAAPEGAGVLLLADGYPDALTEIDHALFEQAAAKRLRLYVEYPAALPEGSVGEVQRATWERGVVTTDAFGPPLARHRIVMIHDGHVAAAETDSALLVMAKVAGFETAVYGLGDTETWPVLYEYPRGDVLVATTKLSQFVTARYAPAEAWTEIWGWILGWLQPRAAPLPFTWEPAVHPTYRPDEPLPSDAVQAAIHRGAGWYQEARMLPHETWSYRYDEAAAYPDRTGPRPTRDLPPGDGTHGVLEGFSSKIHWNGSQAVRWYLRADCISETAMTLALRDLLEPGDTDTLIAANLLDFLYRTSPLHQGPRADPASPDYGLVGWNLTYDSVHYGDDNARVLLSTMATAAALQTDRWDDAMARALLANFRTTGPDGFRSNRLEGPQIRANGWEHYWHTPRQNYAPHYESWLWATYLWFYDKTGFTPLLERTRRGLRSMMAAYPDEWHWTNGLQQERARLLLPLAWLVRVADTPEHRAWLAQIAGDLLAHQAASGAIQEELGSTGHGKYGPPASNAAYGTTEAPLIQQNGDPIADLLYTSNFAFLSLHEAAAATGDPALDDARDRLGDFLLRVQVRAPGQPELDGAWFRAFDHRRWEYWASNADLGWGAWAIETGWTQSWITSVLALGALETSLWDLTADTRIADRFEIYRRQMLPDRVLNATVEGSP